MSHFHWLYDGGTVGLYLLLTMAAGVMMRRHVGRVEHFLVAGREMNVYLGIASLAATEFGIVSCMYAAQNGYDKGFAGMTPGLLSALAMLVVGLTGFCIKPLRDSGVMTIPELLEKRFGRGVRSASGLVIVLGGLLNMGVFLRTGGQFLVDACGLAPKVTIFGHEMELLVLLMTALLAGVSVYTILGGMLSVLVTDFLQFIVMSLGLLIVTFLVLHDIGWDRLVSTVQTHHGPGGFNPLLNPAMGWPYLIFNGLVTTAAVLTWQTTVARVLAAKDSGAGRRIYTGTAFFFVCRFLIPGIWGVAALATLSPDVVGPDSLLAMPKFLGAFVPVGLMGLLIAAMLAADMSTDSSYMLTWSAVIYNDILAPFRRRPWTEKRGLLINRCLVALIGVFLLFYGLWYPLKGDLWTYLGVTGTIYLSSMSTLLIACCYWNKANDWGATAAIAVGALVPAGYLVIEQMDSTKDLAAKIGPYYSGIATYVLVALAMVAGSLLKPEPRKGAAS
jgi:solute:Na+ symporter, SSS family